jgi:MFS family permease
MKDITGNTPRLGLPLAMTCVAQFVVVLDVTIVTTALPVVRSSFESSANSLQWIITWYTLAFGGLLITGGRLADLIGPRRTFLLGLVIFTTASGACALAWCQAALVGARVVQGVGSALLSPAALALLSAVSSPGAPRRRAVGWWTAAAATGGASGWLLGGVLTEYLSWRAVFWVNLPIGIATSLVAMSVLPAGYRTSGRRLDLLGSIAVTGALALLVYGLTRMPSSSVTSPASWIPILIAAVGLGLVVRHERRIADPLVPQRLFRSRPSAGANLTALLITATTTPAMYLATLYVQQQLHLRPARASLLFPMFNIAVIGGSSLGPTCSGGSMRVQHWYPDSSG